MERSRSGISSFKELFAFALCICLLLVGGIFAATSRTEAYANQPFTGYAWGASYLAGSTGEVGGIGWISFNCANEYASTTCPFPYSVKLDSSNYLIGYAWSSNFGWVKFGGLSGFPTGGGTVAQNAQISGNNLIGWARACAGTVSNDCVSASRSDFDGWISMSGTSYGVTVSGTQLSGYAWGGPDIGAISFNAVSTGACRGVCLGAIPTVDLKADAGSGNSDGPVSVASGTTTVALSWTSANIAAGIYCTTSSTDKNDKQWPSTTRPSASTSTVSYRVTSSVVVSISCTDSAGVTAKDSVTINISGGTPPSVDLKVYDPIATPAAYVDGPVTLSAGDAVRFSWTSSGATSCVGYGFSVGSATSSAGAQYATASTSQSYSLKCSNATGDKFDTAQVNVYDASGSCADPAGGSPIPSGQSRTYYLKPQGNSCTPVSRLCTAGVLGGDTSYNSATCTSDPAYIEQ